LARSAYKFYESAKADRAAHEALAKDYEQMLTSPSEASGDINSDYARANRAEIDTVANGVELGVSVQDLSDSLVGAGGGSVTAAARGAQTAISKTESGIAKIQEPQPTRPPAQEAQQPVGSTSQVRTCKGQTPCRPPSTQALGGNVEAMPATKQDGGGL
jgi:hypothetical protein